MKSGILAGALAVVVAAAPASAQVFDVKICTQTVNDTQHLLGNRLAEELNKRSNGRFNARMFPASQLGSPQRMVEGLQLGTQEIFLAPPSFLAGVDPAFQVTDAPGVFDDVAHGHRTVTDPEFRKKFLALGEQGGVVGTHVYGITTFSYTFREPVRSIAEFRGKKVRVLATRMESEMMAALGATGVPMPFSDAVPAIQNRTVDGARSAVIVNTPLKFHDVAKYTVLTNESLVTSIGAVSKRWFDSLPADLRKLVTDLCAENETWAYQLALDLTKKAEDGWRAAGGELIELRPEERKDMMARMRAVGDKVMRDNPRTKDMYELMLATAQKMRR
jgi:TRAP-type C4-dicarboxylate transport system substrate-binding protein